MMYLALVGGPMPVTNNSVGSTSVLESQSHISITDFMDDYYTIISLSN